MKQKNLKKKIRQLEKRLREGPAKLAKLRRKLQAAEAKKKSPDRASGAAGIVRESAKAQKSASAKAGAQSKLAGGEASGVPKKVKRKLNLSPERRAQLSATMKARWEARKAAANSPSVPAAQDFSVAGSA